MQEPEAFPWAAVMAACLGRLGWTPDVFWTATPREVAAALAGLGMRHGQGTGRLARPGLEALMRRFPDKAHEEGGGGDDRTR
ncbi:rcc01693 family protein [Stappia sp.]|uniref:rcc01693 family protein n=1 Tax=Stappia sp. TaxID=1870903 RepID=UPI003A990141